MGGQKQQIYCSDIVISTSLKKKMIVCLSVGVIDHYQPGILRDNVQIYVGIYEGHLIIGRRKLFSHLFFQVSCFLGT
jgi:hypothetical protein